MHQFIEDTNVNVITKVNKKYFPPILIEMINIGDLLKDSEAFVSCENPSRTSQEFSM